VVRARPEWQELDLDTAMDMVADRDDPGLQQPRRPWR
jgi:hypothetical protein